MPGGIQELLLALHSRFTPSSFSQTIMGQGLSRAIKIIFYLTNWFQKVHFKNKTNKLKNPQILSLKVVVGMTSGLLQLSSKTRKMTYVTPMLFNLNRGKSKLN